MQWMQSQRWTRRVSQTSLVIPAAAMVFSCTAPPPAPPADVLTTDSMLIERLRYDREEDILEVRFSNGLAYEYFDVDEKTYRYFVDAPGKGGYFRDNIHQYYPSRKLGGGPPGEQP